MTGWKGLQMPMQPLRFAMVTTFYPPFNLGRDGIAVQRLSRALVARGHSVDVIHDTDAYRFLSGDAPEIPYDNDGVRVHRLRSPNKVWSSLTVQQLGRPTTHRERLLELLDDRYDVIHYHNISLVGGPGVWSLGTGVKLHTAYDFWLVCPSHILWRDGKEPCDSKRCIRCVVRHRRPPQLWRAGNSLVREARNIDAFMALSESSKQLHRKFGFEERMTVVPPFLPFETPNLKTTRPTDTNKRPFFLYVGRLDHIRGLQNLIPHFDENLDADLFIAGSGDFENELRQLANGNPKIKFLGQKPMEELRKLYHDARALVMPSLGLETFPLVVMEAFREGTPLIANNIAPYPELIRETGGGAIYRTDQDLAGTLRRFLMDDGYASDLGRKAFAGFARRWREDVSMERYFDVIREVAQRRGLSQLIEKLDSPADRVAAANEPT